MNAGIGRESAPPSVHQSHPAAPTVTAAGAVASKDRKSSAGDDKEDEGTDRRGLDATRRSNGNVNGGVSVDPLLPPSATVPPNNMGSNGGVEAANDDDDGAPLSESPTTPLASNQNPPTTIIQPSSPPSTHSSTTPTDPASLDGLRSSRNSLTSSRPAPPSPAVSRRASAALSRRSSTRDRPTSTSAPANPHGPDADADPTASSKPGAPSPTTPTPAQPHLQQARRASSLAPAASVLVKIRDFAFPDEDVRHIGAGPLTPRPNRRLQRPLSTWSASSASSTSSNDDRDDPGGGSSYGFAGWGLGRLSWFGVRGGGGGAAADGGGYGGGVPSQGDFERNFEDAVSPSYEIDDPYASLDDDDDFDDYEDGGGEYHAGEQAGKGVGEGEVDVDVERPLLPGLYRALYAFEPEGTAEMALEEDQIVRVVGRGGGVGWAIVARSGDEGHALVPEGYLELVSLDREQLGEEDG